MSASNREPSRTALPRRSSGDNTASLEPLETASLEPVEMVGLERIEPAV